jgi:FkbM family methyltransferase
MSSQKNIDEIILKNLGKTGFFVEAGGSVPIEQNNTYLLEKNGWKGLIVEPKIDFNQKYQEIRPNTIVENYVLVSSNFDSDTIMADFSKYMMGSVENIHGFSNFNPTPYSCIPLYKLLEKHNITHVNFLSLDVEGYEEEVLNGIDFHNVFFDVILVELHQKNGKQDDFSFLENYNFTLFEDMSGHFFYINKNSNFLENFVI